MTKGEYGNDKLGVTATAERFGIHGDSGCWTGVNPPAPGGPTPSSVSFDAKLLFIKICFPTS